MYVEFGWTTFEKLEYFSRNEITMLLELMHFTSYGVKYES